MARNANLVEESKKDIKIEDLMNIIQGLQNELTSLKNENKNLQNSNIGGQVIIKQNEDLTRIVKVTSLLNNSYNLSTERNGKGNIFMFKKFGETKNIKFTDMQKILEVYRKDFEIGRAVLSSKKDYEDLQIGYAYDNVLNTKQMKDLICLKEDSSVDAILNMDEDIQDNIASLIAKKIIEEGYSYDYNKIKKLEDSGVQISEFEKMLQKDNK